MYSLDQISVGPVLLSVKLVKIIILISMIIRDILNSLFARTKCKHIVPDQTALRLLVAFFYNAKCKCVPARIR